MGMGKPMTIWSQIGSDIGMGLALPYLHKPIPLSVVLQVLQILNTNRSVIDIQFKIPKFTHKT